MLFFFFIVLILVDLSASSSKPDFVQILTRENITDVTDGSPWLLEFYAPWCGHCKHLEPIWKQTAASLSDHTKVAKIDGHKYADVSARFNINGFPTIFHVINQEVRQYAGDRSRKDLELFARSGYKDVEPLGMRQSPFSPVGIAWGLIARAGLLIKDVQDYLLSDKSYPLPVVIAGTLTALFVMSMLFAFLVVKCISFFEKSEIKPKRD